jgi:hypothetical protein
MHQDRQSHIFFKSIAHTKRCSNVFQISTSQYTFTRTTLNKPFLHSIKTAWQNNYLIMQHLSWRISQNCQAIPTRISRVDFMHTATSKSPFGQPTKHPTGELRLHSANHNTMMTATCWQCKKYYYKSTRTKTGFALDFHIDLEIQLSITTPMDTQPTNMKRQNHWCSYLRDTAIQQLKHILYCLSLPTPSRIILSY